MLSLVIIIIGTFWEASMDIIGTDHNYRRSIWCQLADYFDKIGKPYLGQRFWDKKIAWRNKWKNGDPKQGEAFPLSSMMFSFLTDGWHVMKFLWIIHFLSAIVHYSPITPYMITDMLIFYYGFGIAHSFFFKILQVKPISE